MKNWHPNRWWAVIGLALVSLLAIALPGSAQSGDCGGAAGCVYSGEFDSGADGWEASYDGLVSSVDIGHLDYKSFGALWWTTEAWGILTMETNSNYDFAHSDQRVGIRQTFNLSAGRYQLVTRIAADLAQGSAVYYNVEGFGAVNTARILSYYDAWQTLSTDDLSPNSFTIDTPGSVTVVIAAGYRSKVYFDYIYLIRLSDATYEPTATPGPGTPTAAPAATATAIPASATPIASGTAYCVPAPATATGLPPDAVATATPTALPGGTNWAYFDGFDNSLNGSNHFWATAGTGVELAYNVGRRALNAVIVPNSADPGGGSMARSALIYRPGTTQLSTFYVDVWAMANFVASGKSQYLEVWKEEGGAWSNVGAAQVSHSSWYPSHWAIPVSTGVTAIAFVAHRSDSATVDKLYLDDIYLYGDLSLSPYCDDTFHPSTVFIGMNTYAPYADGITLSINAGRACPANVLRPNNLWGMLLAQLTILLDQITALAPGHILGQTLDLAQQYITGPLGGVIILATFVFDWSIPILMLEIYIAFQGGLLVIGIWKTIRRAFIV